MNLDTYGGRIEKGRGILLLRNCFLSMWEKPGDMDLQGPASSHLSHASLSRSVNFDSDSVLLLHPQTHVHIRHIDRGQFILQRGEDTGKLTTGLRGL